MKCGFRHTWPSRFVLSVDVLRSFPYRPSHAEQAERGDRAPSSLPPPTSEYHFLPALPPHLHDTTEFPTPPPTPPGRHTPEAVPTPPASPHLPPPHTALAPSPVPSTNQREDHCPASAPCHPPLRYELYLTVTVPEPVHLTISLKHSSFCLVVFKNIMNCELCFVPLLC